MPFNVEAIMAVAHRYQIPVLEDSAEVFGSCYKNQKASTFGTIGVLSFNGNKIITT
jgi:dTDP-4-amino-4,6-dideoxygalactose transaminase